MKDEKNLESLMNRWESGFSSDPDLLSKVKGQIRREEAVAARSGGAAPSAGVEGFIEWVRGMLTRPAFASAFAAVFVMVGMGLSQFLSGNLRSEPEGLTVTYRLSIDPLYRLQAVAGANEMKGQRAFEGEERAPMLTASVGWLQGELNLSRAQYERVLALHSDYGDAFDELFLEMLSSHNQYRKLDQKRMSNDVIDYFQLYELLQNQRHLSEQSARLTTELLRKVSEIITPEQRERYQRLLDNIYPDLSRTDRKTTNA